MRKNHIVVTQDIDQITLSFTSNKRYDSLLPFHNNFGHNHYHVRIVNYIYDRINDKSADIKITNLLYIFKYSYSESNYGILVLGYNTTDIMNELRLYDEKRKTIY